MQEASGLLKSIVGKGSYTSKVVIDMGVVPLEFFRSGKYDLDFKSPNDPSKCIFHDQQVFPCKFSVKDW